MKTNRKLVATILWVSGLIAGSGRAHAASAAPSVVNYQGVLRGTSGAPLGGSFNMVFRFFSVPVGGTLILQDRHTDQDFAGRVTVAGGLFNVQLGSGDLRDALFNQAAPGAFMALFRQNTDVYLEVQVDSETLAPRTKVVSAPYALSGPHGVVYTRWGKFACPAGATLVYTGFAAGGLYNGVGATNQLCLASEPTWDQYNDANQTVAAIYGTEYQTNVSGIPSLASISDEDAPCAVCLQPDADTMFMYPGRGYNSLNPSQPACPEGWRTEYSGYLMSGAYSGRDAICMDRAPDTIVGGSANTNGSLWYTTEGICGTLPCPPYEQYREITCSVCTR